MEGFAQGVIDFDRELTLLVNSFHTPFTDSFWKLISDTAVWIPLYLAVLAVIVWRLGWKKALVALSALIFAILSVDQLGNLVKEATGRLRPCHDYRMLVSGLNVPVSKGGMYGFYSAHSANAFAFAMASLLLLRADRFRRYGSYAVLIFFWAFLVALSRVFLAKHFVGDIAAGAAVGIAIGYVSGTVARMVMRRMDKR